jgi:hypothetical protein
MLSRLTPLVSLLFLASLGGCAMHQVAAEAPMPGEGLAGEAAAADTGSLFPGDQLVLNDAQIEKIFATRIAVPDGAKLAVVRYGRWPAGFWSEESARLDQQSIDGLLAKLRAVKHVRAAQVVPEMLLPRQMDVPHLRETAARVQADLLLIYRPTSRSYGRSQFLKKDATRAYCTVEVALLDTRSGVITFTTRATENFAAEKSSGDMNAEETAARAEQEAVGRAMLRLGADVAAFLEGEAK